jgi:hypothetical protein|tara:strand:+ start:61 stop:804 length:744 start_codon:yes stop_codon:yes gene_type:complete
MDWEDLEPSTQREEYKPSKHRKALRGKYTKFTSTKGSKKDRSTWKKMIKTDKIHKYKTDASGYRETFRTGESPASIQRKMKRNYLRDWARVIKPEDWKLGKTPQTRSPIWGSDLREPLLKKKNRGWKAGQEKKGWMLNKKLKLIPVRYGGKQVLPTVGRTVGRAIGVTSGWGTLIAGVSLLAQTKKAKKFREDPIHRKATIKKLFHTKNKFPIFTISPSVARFFEKTGHKPSKKYPPKIKDPYWGKN